MSRPDWWDDAACRGRVDLLDRFVPMTPIRNDRNKRRTAVEPDLAELCAACPVTNQCYASGYSDRYAVRGGLTAAQRAKDRKIAAQRERRLDVRAG